MKRAVITGIGAITPLANNFSDSWRSVKEGRSGIGEITRFDPLGLPWRMAGEIKDFDAALYLGAKERARVDIFAQYAIAAALMAAEDAGFKDKSTLPVNAGIIIGSSRGGIAAIERASGALHGKGRVSPYLMPSTTICMAASHAAYRLGAKGHCLGISNACASGANAVGEAFRLIRHGRAEMVFAGGAEASVCRLCVEGYGSAGALSKGGAPSASSPFDKGRDGFVIAEGAAVLVLEELSSAQKRNARIYGEVVGYGNTTDAFHMTQPDPEGEARAIAAALEEAGIVPDEVDYINAHGTSTVLGDKAEAGAIRAVFGKKKVPVSALKSMTGHMLAASGAFEVACAAMSLREGIIPPSINFTQRDPACDINIVTKRTDSPMEIALSHSFGFGGVNAVLALKKA